MLFTVYIGCYLIATKFIDEKSYVSIKDLAFMAHSTEKRIKIIEKALLEDFLDWKVLNLKSIDSKGNFKFLNWNYKRLVDSFDKIFADI